MARMVKPEMAYNPEEFRARLKAAITKAGGKRAVSKSSGIPERSIGHYLAGTAEPKAAALRQLSDALRVSVDWLLDKVSTAQLISEPDMADFALIPRLDFRVSAGAGVIVWSEEPTKDVVAFRRDYLTRLGINPSRARAIFASGDSMEPTIRDGDLLLVDESVDRIMNDGIYVVVYQGMARVKRVQRRRDGSFILKSDNERYQPEVVPQNEIDQITVAGRVRWYGHTV